MNPEYGVALSSTGFATVLALFLLAGCGEPMQFANAGSKHTLAQDEASCNQELDKQTGGGVAYAQETMGRVDPLQTCIERKGWRRVDRPRSAPLNR